MANKITEQYLEELERKIKILTRALKRKNRFDKIGDKIPVDVPFVNKKIDYTVTEQDRQKIEQEATDKEKEFKDKLKEIEEKPAKI